MSGTTKARCRSGNPSAYDLDHRRALVVDAVERALDTYPRQSAGPNPLIDTMLLFLQRAAVLSFRSPGARWSTLRDPELASRGFIDQLDRHLDTTKNKDWISIVEGVEFVAHTYAFDDSRTRTRGITFTRVRKSLLEDLLPLMHRPVREAFAERVSRQPTCPIVSPSASTLPIDLERQNRLAKFVRQIIDDALADSAEMNLLKAEGNLDIPNLFAVVRLPYLDGTSRCSCFEYTGHLLLTSGQEARIREHFKPDFTFVDRLQRPLGVDARSIADSVFASGLIDFSSEEYGTGRDTGGSNPANADDRERRLAEKQLFQAVSPSNSHTCYVPIHVGGLPWIALFTLSGPVAATRGQISDDAWGHNFRFYTWIAPTLANRIRDKTQTTYLTLLRKEIGRALAHSQGADPVDSLNARIMEMATVFPFSPARLSRVPVENANLISFPDGRRIWLSLGEYNPYFYRHIDFGILSQSDVADSFKQAIEEEEARNAHLQVQLYEELEFQRHTIRNRLPTMLFKFACEDARKLSLPPESQTFLEDAWKATEIVQWSLDIWTESHREPMSLADLLRWLDSRTLSGEIRPAMQIDPHLDYAVFSKPHLDDLFTVIWNLWNNAEYAARTNRGEFLINAISKQDAWEINLINVGEMAREWADYLDGKRSFPEERKRGLQVVKTKCARQGWLVERMSSPAGYTAITLRIPKTNGPNFDAGGGAEQEHI